MIFLRKPSASTLQRALVKQSMAQPSYPQVGATAQTLPSGYRHDELSIEIGRGRKVFETSASFLDGWGLQRSMGFSVYPEGSLAETDTTVLLSLPIVGLSFLAPCRVIYTVGEATRHGIAYGTLPNHPETGEEYFGVAIDDNDIVRFELRAFSKPRAVIAKMGGPITRKVQMMAMNRYANNMASFAQSVQQG